MENVGQRNIISEKFKNVQLINYINGKSDLLPYPLNCFVAWPTLRNFLCNSSKVIELDDTDEELIAGICQDDFNDFMESIDLLIQEVTAERKISEANSKTLVEFLEQIRIQFPIVRFQNRGRASIICCIALAATLFFSKDHHG
jgi:hypothetical protein